LKTVNFQDNGRVAIKVFGTAPFLARSLQYFEVKIKFSRQRASRNESLGYTTVFGKVNVLFRSMSVIFKATGESQ
jgi:hypothetical protein